MSSSDDYSQYMDKQSKCSKPPISICLEGCTFDRSTAQPSELHPAAHAARPSYGESPSLRSEMERDLHTDGGNKHPLTKLPDLFGNRRLNWHVLSHTDIETSRVDMLWVDKAYILKELTSFPVKEVLMVGKVHGACWFPRSMIIAKYSHPRKNSYILTVWSQIHPKMWFHHWGKKQVSYYLHMIFWL